MPPSTRARLLAPLALLALTAGCKSLKEGAREEFSHHYSCPSARIEVRRRADVRAWDVAFGRSGPSTPPDEVAKDPERLAVWRRDQEGTHAAWNSAFEVYEARGCGHEVLMTCAHPDAPEGGTLLSSVSCSEGEYPPGARTRW